MTDVSIVIPAWGAHVNYLPPAIESLLAQNGPEIEIVVVDNCSDVPLPELDPAVRAVRTPQRLAVGAARNFGLHQAKSPYVMFWDADDVLLEGALARMHGVISADPGIVIVTMDSVRWTPETGPSERWPWPRSVMYRLSRHRRVIALVALLYNPFTTTGPALMRTSAVRDAGGFAEDIAFFEDWALSGSLTVRGRVVMLREIARWYRVHEGSLSLGHLDNPAQSDWLRGMRRRTWRDPRVPVWLKALRPLVRLHHLQREHRRRRSQVGGAYYESALERIGEAAETSPPDAASR